MTNGVKDVAHSNLAQGGNIREVACAFSARYFKELLFGALEFA